MTEKRDFTPEEEAKIIEIRDRHIANQTVQPSDEEVHAAINRVWDIMELPHPTIHILPSPKACKEACPDLANYSKYWFLWYCSYVVMYEFAEYIGLEMDQEKLKTFKMWNNCCPFVIFNEDTVYVTKKPVEIHLNDRQQLHNENGMSVKFEDGVGIYTINNVDVDEQIVMHPETQTIKQINEEQNEEVKRIRIERYGWSKYLDKIKAKLVDKRSNKIERTKEFLFRSDKDNMTALLCICPSTRKEFVLEVPPDTKTCEEAQDWLSSGIAKNIISAS